MTLDRRAIDALHKVELELVYAHGAEGLTQRERDAIATMAERAGRLRQRLLAKRDRWSRRGEAG